ncbi:hypothetical protein HMI55_004626 [Coelomomyces lativittatus]|nr:hypothetical protein HMI55_004626 [Coelomomyces lativittatus]
MAEEDTEWNTILREKGILPPSQQEFQKNKNDLPWIQSKSISTKLKEKEEEEEEEEEEDLDLDIDEKMFEHFKNERLKEYQTAADLHSNRGTLITLESHEEFTKKVTKASVSMDVIVHLFDETLRGKFVFFF